MKTTKLYKTGISKLTLNGYTLNRNYFLFANFKLVLKRIFSIKLFGYRLTIQKETFKSKIPSKSITTVVDKYVKKNFPNSKWHWTTVDMFGMPQVIVVRGNKWRLIRQSEIKRDLK